MLIEIIKALLMGIVEGVTEWLPISSTGHMILEEQLIQFEASDAFISMFRVVIPLGVIMAAYYLLAAILQPVSEERITGCLTGMGHAVRLLFQTVFTVLVLFLLTIALATAASG